MNGLQIRLTDLLVILEQNLTEHRKIFEEALAGYRTALLDYLESQIEKIKKNKQAIRVQVSLPMPEDHSSDYERVIRMVRLAMDAGQETIELNEYDAAQFVMDDWGWKKAFADTSSFYLAHGQ